MENIIYRTNEIVLTPRKQMTKKPWQNYSASLEITTSVPKGGCTVDCIICPQKLLIDQYGGDRFMKLDTFKTFLDKVPNEVIIIFSGFVEPWLNKNATDMLYHAHQKGHPVSVYTTGVGMQPEDVERLTQIPYFWNHKNGSGGFCLHLPDAEGVGRHPITPTYIETIKEFHRLKDKINYFHYMAMGPTPHPQFKDMFPKHWLPEFFSRAGNLDREATVKPELATARHLYRPTSVAPESRTCGCDEHLYHNILLPNGDVSLCCMDYAQEYIIGSLVDKDYEAIMPEVNTSYELCRSCHCGVPKK